MPTHFVVLNSAHKPAVAYPSVLPAGWTLVLDERFNSLSAWDLWDAYHFWASDILASNIALRSGGGIDITGHYVAGSTNDGGVAASKALYQYGYFECRCKIPSGSGLWPAFYLYALGDNVAFPEADVFEWISDNNLYFTNHLNGGQSQQIVAVGDITGVYHKFAAIWAATGVKYYFDDTLMATITSQVPQVPMNILVELLIGGWPPDPATSPVTAVFSVDYVRVWQP